MITGILIYWLTAFVIIVLYTFLFLNITKSLVKIQDQINIQNTLLEKMSKELKFLEELAKDGA